MGTEKFDLVESKKYVPTRMVNYLRQLARIMEVKGYDPEVIGFLSSRIFENAQRDADRYQWLKANLGSTLAGIASMHCPRGTLLTLDQLDKIIDTAMESKNANTET